MITKTPKPLLIHAINHLQTQMCTQFLANARSFDYRFSFLIQFSGLRDSVIRLSCRRSAVHLSPTGAWSRVGNFCLIQYSLGNFHGQKVSLRGKPMGSGSISKRCWSLRLSRTTEQRIPPARNLLSWHQWSAFYEIKDMMLSTACSFLCSLAPF